MSVVTLLSRQLHALRLGQGAAAAGSSCLAPVLRAASPPAVLPITITPSSSLRLLSPIPIHQHHYYSDTTYSRTLSSHANIHEQHPPSSDNDYKHHNDDNDDGGPVTSSTPAAMKNNLQSMSIKELSDMSTIPGWNLVHNPPRKNPRGALVGRVVSDKMQKTVNVAVDRYKIIPKYRKRWRFTKKFMAHDEHEVCNMGDLVMIVPCQKISRHKHFMVREIIRPKGLL